MRKQELRKHVRKILATSEPLGNLEEVERLAKKVADTDVEAVAVLGSLASKSATTRAYGNLFKILAETRLPTFYIPGPEDAPLYEYLREAANMEIVYPYLRGVHATFAIAPGYIVFTGIGGTVIDDPHMLREEVETLRYPGWEVEYQLKFLDELKDYQKVFLFLIVRLNQEVINPIYKGEAVDLYEVAIDCRYLAFALDFLLICHVSIIEQDIHHKHPIRLDARGFCHPLERIDLDDVCHFGRGSYRFLI